MRAVRQHDDGAHGACVVRADRERHPCHTGTACQLIDEMLTMGHMGGQSCGWTPPSPHMDGHVRSRHTKANGAAEQVKVGSQSSSPAGFQAGFRVGFQENRAAPRWDRRPHPCQRRRRPEVHTRVSRGTGCLKHGTCIWFRSSCVRWLCYCAGVPPERGGVRRGRFWHALSLPSAAARERTQNAPIESSWARVRGWSRACYLQTGCMFTDLCFAQLLSQDSFDPPPNKNKFPLQARVRVLVCMHSS